MMRRICTFIAKHLPLRVITRDDGRAYLARYYLCGPQPKHFPVVCGRCERWMDPRGNARCALADGACEPAAFPERLTFLPTVFLHRFLRSDGDLELHNHPWDRSLSFILAGGYREERRRRVLLDGRELDVVEQRVVRPFRFNRIDADDFHRVDLLEDDAWTVFITGPKVKSWGFWDRFTGEYIDWREHLRRARAAGGAVRDAVRDGAGT